MFNAFRRSSATKAFDDCKAREMLYTSDRAEDQSSASGASRSPRVLWLICPKVPEGMEVSPDLRSNNTRHELATQLRCEPCIYRSGDFTQQVILTKSPEGKTGFINRYDFGPPEEQPPDEPAQPDLPPQD